MIYYFLICQCFSYNCSASDILNSEIFFIFRFNLMQSQRKKIFFDSRQKAFFGNVVLLFQTFFQQLKIKLSFVIYAFDKLVQAKVIVTKWYGMLWYWYEHNETTTLPATVTTSKIVVMNEHNATTTLMTNVFFSKQGKNHFDRKN